MDFELCPVIVTEREYWICPALNLSVPLTSGIIITIIITIAIWVSFEKKMNTRKLGKKSHETLLK